MSVPEPPKRFRLEVPKDLEGPQGKGKQPVSKIVWVPREKVRANDFNPNQIAPPELRLLKISLLEDGWTQPLVVRQAEEEGYYELIDGAQRWTAAADKRVAAMTGGEVPISVNNPRDRNHQMMSTVRHNRARGSHFVLGMAEIAIELHAAGIPNERIRLLLQMEEEELNRLLARGDMEQRGSKEGFNSGWVPA